MTKKLVEGLPTYDWETLETFPDVEIVEPHNLVQNGQPLGLVLVPFDMYAAYVRREHDKLAQLSALTGIHQALLTPQGMRLPKPKLTP
ncbi:MAG: hypothetical protein EOP83_02410 [Verrucomicrobiaceae bacterium]|nr:MAG: hypothetical protein EOP83_02410 [Verrucomicrobiaceae bacterium]